MDNYCSQLQLSCSNFSDNLVATYYDYWLSKVEIINDNTGNLIDTFDDINFMRMYLGMVPVLLDYGNGITITRAIDIRYDKNNQPLGGTVQVNLDRQGTRNLFAIDWKLYLHENKEILNNILTQLGFSNAKIIDNPDSRFLQVINDIPIFKTIFFKNNRQQQPSLFNLNNIIANIHDLSHINERNHKVINTLYVGKSNRKLSREQANNSSLTITCDGYGAIITDNNVNQNSDKNDIGDNFQKDVVTQSLNNWDKIKDEIETWEDKFQKYSGMPSEKLSNQRENLGETLQRTARVNATEKQYYKYIKKFIDEYDKYFETEIEYQFDNLITDNMQLYQTSMFTEKQTIKQEESEQELGESTNE